MKNVLARIDPDEVVTLTRDLVRLPSVIRPGDCPRALRPAMENGNATPTRNENDG